VDAFNRLLRKRDLGPITCSRKEAS
jgi:hypothetical protein